ncbi:carbohydrate ABC transporter permease [Dictyobacter aurantiacus]|uniref:Sugar ABC transporter permease n=1 Tax=Dictyobacter aurantiacus TaxID=1936993 RepID=A0A401Z7X7_9CHLR|nr:sugar ABC transporter permease [Dictyobacter aurantiacus]GCE02970.1 sugar ABC transporter permease [Dictyobacter aurantiacus]
MQKSLDRQQERYADHRQAEQAVVKRNNVPVGKVIRKNLVAYLFLLPALLGFALFSVYPIISSFIIGFQYYDMVNPPRWVGFFNFVTVLRNPLLLISVENCFTFLLWALIPFLIPFFMAMIVNELPRWGGYLRFTYYLPAILPPVVTFYLWKWMYDPSGAGLINVFLASLHLPTLAWLDSPTTVIPSMAFIGIWGGTGSGMLIYLAALQNIPPHLYDAAEIDGASIWRKFWHITLPQMRIILLLNLMFAIMGAFQTFDGPFLLTGGGPVNSSVTPVLLVYKYAFEQGNYGAANALSLILFAFLMIFSILYLYLMRRTTGLGKY